MTNREREKTWSLAGSAHSARDAKIAAIWYVREASAERQWYAAMLAHGHEARTVSTGDPAAPPFAAVQHDGLLASVPAGLGPGKRGGPGRRGALPGGGRPDLYVLTPQMLDVVFAAAQTLNFGDLGLLRATRTSRTGSRRLPRRTGPNPRGDHSGQRHRHGNRAPVRPPAGQVTSRQGPGGPANQRRRAFPSLLVPSPGRSAQRHHDPAARPSGHAALRPASPMASRSWRRAYSAGRVPTPEHSARFVTMLDRRGRAGRHRAVSAGLPIAARRDEH